MDTLAQAAADAPHLPALRTQTHTFTFRELDAETQRMEIFLREKNVQPGDRVAAQLETGPFFISLLVATLRLGALFCPLSLRLPSIEPHLHRLGAKLCFTTHTCTTLPASASSSRRSELLLFTSGTTGTPKIACLPQRSLEASAISATSTLDLRPADAWLLSLPLYHVGGLGIIFRCLHARACMTFSGAEATHISYVPTQLYRGWPVAKRLRCLLLGGAPIAQVPRELPIVCSYGMTETASLVLADGRPLPGKEVKLVDGEIFVRGDSMFSGYWEQAEHEEPIAKVHGCRKPMILSPFPRASEACPVCIDGGLPGKAGEEMQTDTGLKGRFYAPKTFAIGSGGWFATNDLGRFENNQFVITGRKDRQFISGGENIQPEEIELALLEHPDVLEAVVSAKPDPEFGMRPIAHIRTLNAHVDLRAFLLKKLPKHKLPVEFLPMPEVFKTKLVT
jgi:O-succinylbenzoic acid--CoA ligase